MSTSPRQPCVPQSDPFPLRFEVRRLWLAIAFAVAALLVIPFEATIHPLVYKFLGMLPLDDYFMTTRQFAGSTFIVALVFLIWLLDPPRRRAVLVLLIALSFSSTANETIKQITGRARPSRALAMNSETREKVEEYIAENPDTRVRAEARDQWMLLRSGRPWAVSNYASFPSGHANTAFVFLAFLIVCYPRGRWLWFLLAVGCALARVRYRRHYTSDILMGGALGWTLAYWVFSWGWPVRLSDWVLARLGHINRNGSGGSDVSGAAGIAPSSDSA